MGPLMIAAIAAAALGGFALYKKNQEAHAADTSFPGGLPPPAPFPDPPPEHQASPAEHAINPLLLGIKMGVSEAAIGMPTTGVVQGSDGTELAFTTIIAAKENGEAVIQWMPPVDVDAGGYNHEFNEKLQPGAYYWAVFI